MKKNKAIKYSLISIAIIVALVLYTIVIISFDRNRQINLIKIYDDNQKEMLESPDIAKLQKQIEKLQSENEMLSARISKGIATNDKVLSGEKVWSNGDVEVGTMRNNGAVAKKLYAGDSYTVLQGYHNGEGQITTATLAEQTVSTATKDKILKNYTAYVNGELVTGTIETLTNNNFSGSHSSTTAGEASDYTVKASATGYVTKNTVVNTLSATTSPTINTTAETGTKTIAIKPGYYNNIKVNQTAAYEAGKASITGGNATEDKILKDYTAYVNGELVKGTIVQRTNGSSVTHYGTDSTGPYIYFNSGYWPVANSTYGSFVRMTKDQVKSFANSAGIGTSLKKIGSSAGTYNLSSYTGYKNFTVGTNIICTSYAQGIAHGGHNTSGQGCNGTASLSVSYNASTGVLTVSNGYLKYEDSTLWGEVYCYCNGVYVTAQ